MGGSQSILVKKPIKRTEEDVVPPEKELVLNKKSKAKSSHSGLIQAFSSVGSEGGSVLIQQISAFLQEESKRNSDCEDITDLDQGKAEVARYRAMFKELSEAVEQAESSILQSISSTSQNQPVKMSRPTVIESDVDGNEMQINNYQLGNVLGVGSFGVVVKGKDVVSGNSYAIKVIDRQRLKRKQFGLGNQVYEGIKREIAIQKRLKHRNILPLVEVIDGGDHPKTYFVTKLIDGGALMPDASKSDPIEEKRARFLFSQLVKALHYLHGLNIIHKDVKPSNLLVETNTDRLYLSDFGVAQVFKEDELCMINSTDGTMAFIAPEMCTGKEIDGKKADIWAAGATLFMMLTGQPPFLASSAHDLVERIASGNVDYSNKGFSPAAENLLRGILCKSVPQRLEWSSIAAHPWTTDDGEIDVALPKHIEQIELSEADIEEAVSPLSFKTFEAIGATVWLAKRSLLRVRTNHDRDGSSRSVTTEVQESEREDRASEEKRRKSTI